MKYAFNIWLSVSFLTNLLCYCPSSEAASSSNESVILNPKMVLNLVDAKSTKKIESEIKFLQSQFNFYQVDLNYRWKLNFESGYEKDRVEALTSTSFLGSEKYKADLTLSRNFLTGTSLGLQLTQTDFDSQFNSSTLPSFRYNQNIFLLNIEQALYPNFLGRFEQKYFESYNQEQKAAELQAEIELEDQKIEALGLFWAAYNGKVNFEESLRIVERYEKLAKKLRTKNNFGYTGPGDLEQALIEYETRKQNLKEDQVSFQKALQSLRDYLGFNKDVDLQLNGEELGSVPARFAKAVNLLKRYKYQQTKAEAAQDLKMFSDSRSAAQISLVGKFAKSGNEPYFSDSIQEFTNNSKDRAYIGVKLSYIFDNESANSENKLRTMQSSLESLKLERKASDLEEQIKIAYDKMQNSFANIEVGKNILKLREKVVEEQTKTFSQGKTDISILIDSINKLSTARINLEKNTSDYQISLLQFLFLTDQSGQLQTH